MKMLLAATAAIQFIGLSVVMPSDLANPKKPGVTIVLPKVNTMAVQNHGTIEAHAAIIAFPAGTATLSNWPDEDLQPVTGYRFVRLNGEHLRFVVSGANKQAVIPAGLPKLNNACATKVPPLGKGYRPPGFVSAAGVVRVPVGHLTACSPIVQGTQRTRVDTRLALTTKGPLIIETTKGTKRRLEINLAPDELVVIGNVPESWLASSPGAEIDIADETTHYHAYFTMLGTAKHGCDPPAESAAPSCGDSPMLPPDDGGGSDEPAQQRKRSQTAQKASGGPQLQAEFATFSCSNTTYP